MMTKNYWLLSNMRFDITFEIVERKEKIYKKIGYREKKRNHSTAMEFFVLFTDASLFFCLRDMLRAHVHTNQQETTFYHYHI